MAKSAVVSKQKQRVEDLADAIVSRAVKHAKRLDDYLEGDGKNGTQYQKARIVVGLIGAAVRVCATIENNRTNDLIEARANQLPPPPSSAGQLPPASQA
jgi:hypothetical protein